MIVIVCVVDKRSFTILLPPDTVVWEVMFGDLTAKLDSLNVCFSVHGLKMQSFIHSISGQTCQKCWCSSKPETIWSLPDYLECCHEEEQIVSAIVKSLCHIMIISKFKVGNSFTPRHGVCLYYYYNLESTVLNKSCKDPLLLETFT